MVATDRCVLTAFFAMILDAVLGEPKWLWNRVPHPAVLMGRAVGYADRRLNNGENKRAKGIAAIAVLSIVAIILGLVLKAIPSTVIDILVVAILIAQKSLVTHVRDVAHALRQSLPDARKAVAQIVGRDVTDMDENDVARSAIESAVENVSDGVIAPLLWFVVAGLPGILLYKIVNTADSMIGHRTEKYTDFGWAAARFDDVLNFIPARITAIMILIVNWRFDILLEVTEDAPLHRSPNAGWPEAATAHSLNIALSGPRSYDGKRQDFPFANPNGIRELNADHIDEVIVLLWKIWGLALIPAIIATLF